MGFPGKGANGAFFCAQHLGYSADPRAVQEPGVEQENP